MKLQTVLRERASKAALRYAAANRIEPGSMVDACSVRRHGISNGMKLPVLLLLLGAMLVSFAIGALLLIDVIVDSVHTGDFTALLLLAAGILGYILISKMNWLIDLAEDVAWEFTKWKINILWLKQVAVIPLVGTVAFIILSVPVIRAGFIPQEPLFIVIYAILFFLAGFYLVVQVLRFILGGLLKIWDATLGRPTEINVVKPDGTAEVRVFPLYKALAIQFGLCHIIQV